MILDWSSGSGPYVLRCVLDVGSDSAIGLRLMMAQANLHTVHVSGSNSFLRHLMA